MTTIELAPADGKLPDRIQIFSPFAEKELAKNIPSAKWDKDAKCWWIPLSWAGCVQCRGTWGSQLQVGPALTAWSRNELASRVGPCLELRTAEDAPELVHSTPQLSWLRPFQRAGVKFLSTARHALLADEMGLGKTVQAIMTLELLGDSAYPALIVAPNSMKRTWVQEFAKWAPTRRVAMVDGGLKSKRQQIALVRDQEADVLVINWEALMSHTRLAGYGDMRLTDKEKTPKELNEIEWSSVVADEAHKAKNPRAKQTRALWWLGDHSKGAAKLMLTGTPVANSPEDLWALMRFVAPEEYPAKTKFIERYALKAWNAFGFMQVMGVLPETKEELFKILDPRMIRRTKAAVLPQLPAKTYTKRYVPLGTKQRKAYDQLRKTMLAELEEGTLVASSPLVRLTRLLQFASAYGELDDAGNLKLTDPSCKVDALEELLPELGDQRAVIFAESRQLIELAYSRLLAAGANIDTKNGERGPLFGKRIGLLTGATSPQEREANKNAFNDGKLDYLLITLGAGGEGLSLTGASVEIFMQRTFSAVKNAQAEDRLHGIGRGQEGMPLEIIDLISDDTIESHVHEVLLEKAERLEEIVRDRETLAAWLDK